MTADDMLNPESSIRRTIHVQPGEQHYVRASLKAGAWDAIPYIEIVPPEEGSQAITNLSYETMIGDGKMPAPDFP